MQSTAKNFLKKKLRTVLHGRIGLDMGWLERIARPALMSSDAEELAYGWRVLHSLAAIAYVPTAGVLLKEHRVFPALLYICGTATSILWSMTRFGGQDSTTRRQRWIFRQTLRPWRS